MLSKSQSCEKWYLQKSSLLKTGEMLHKTAKKPEQIEKKFEELYKDDKRIRNKKQQKIEENQKKKQQQQLKGCTFKPDIKSNPQYYVSKDSFLERQINWKKALDRKLEEKRQQLAKKQSEAFTFKSKILGTDSIITSQLENTNSLNYHSKNGMADKKSYRNIHKQNKKYKEITNKTTVEPFKHRRAQPTLENSNNKLARTIQQEMKNTHKNNIGKPNKTTKHEKPQQQNNSLNEMELKQSKIVEQNYQQEHTNQNI